MPTIISGVDAGSNGTTTVSASLDCGSGANRGVMAQIASLPFPAVTPTLTALTLGGVDMLPYTVEDEDIWRLSAPVTLTGSQTLLATFGNADGFKSLIAVSLSDVDQTTPSRVAVTSDTNASTSTDCNFTITSASGELCVLLIQESGNPGLTPGAGSSTIAGISGAFRHGLQETGASSVVIGGTFASSVGWYASAFSVRPAVVLSPADDYENRIIAAGGTLNSSVKAAIAAAYTSGDMAKVTDLWLGCGASTLASQLVPVETSVAGLTAVTATGYVAGDHISTGIDAGLNDYSNMTGGATTTKTLHLGAVPMVANTAVIVVGWTGTNSSVVEMTTGSTFPKVTQGDVNRVDFAVHGFGGGDYSGPTGRLVGDVMFVRQGSSALRGYLNGVQAFELTGATAGTVGTGNLRISSTTTGVGKSIAAVAVIPGATYAEALAIRTRIMAMVAAAGRVNGVTTYVYPGDSLTNGFGATSYITRLRGLSGMGGRHVPQALNGQTAAAIDSTYVAQVQSLRPDAVYSPTGWVLPWVGTNDLGGGATDTAVLALLQSIWNKATADGFSAGRFTILPRADGPWTGTMETRRLALNTAIRSNSTANTRLFDVASISQLADPNNTTYYNADKLHLTQAGYDLVADYVQSVLMPDAVAPNITSPAAVATGNTTATGSVSTDEANGTLWRKMAASASADPGAGNEAANGWSSSTVTATGAQTGLLFTGLTTDTAVVPSYFHVDAADNRSAVVTGSSVTPSTMTWTGTYPPQAGVSGAAFVHTGSIPTPTGGIGAKTYSATGLGASGLTMNTSTGQLQGTNGTAGTYNVTPTVTDSSTAGTNPTGGGSPPQTRSLPSFVLTITATGIPPTVLLNPTNLTVTDGATASFTASFSGSPSPTLQWQEFISGSWTAMSGQTSNLLSLGAVTLLDNGRQFRLGGTNASGGPIYTNGATLTVTASSVGTITSDILAAWGNDTPIASTTIPFVTIERISDAVIVLQLTNRVTEASGRLIITNAAIVPGTAYMLAIRNADGTVRGFKRYVAT